MALIAVQPIVIAGLAPVYSAVSASDTLAAVDQGGPKFLHVKNAGGTQDIVTIVVPGTYLGVALADATVTVPITTGDRMIAIPKEAIDPATGLVTILHSFTTSVTCAFLSLG